MQNEEIKSLLNKYKNGDCSDAERAMVAQWYLEWSPEAFDLSEDELASDLKEIKGKLPKNKRKKVAYYQVAAAILLFLSAALYFINDSALKHQFPKNVFSKRSNEILPGGSKAILTLSDGREIILDTAANGQISKEQGIQISKTAEGTLVYRFSKAAENLKDDAQQPVMNTISTPNGGQYEVYLPDGTHVWLNAASSLHFPVSFARDSRIVDLQGEAYFEVSKDAHKPFTVRSGSQEVAVLGTRFNINAYTNEHFIKTTLLEGKVKVTKDKATTFLYPGQEALNHAGNAALKVVEVTDPTAAVAWKNGVFMFDKESVTTIMNKISRWYDVTIEYRGVVKDKTYGGNISRFEDINEVLKTMELTGTIHFKIEGRRIIVMP